MTSVAVDVSPGAVGVAVSLVEVVALVSRAVVDALGMSVGAVLVAEETADSPASVGEPGTAVS